jgi:hypothetical protein
MVLDEFRSLMFTTGFPYLPLYFQAEALAWACRLEGGALMHAEHAHNEDMGGIESMIDMDAGFVDDEDSGDEDSGDEVSLLQTVIKYIFIC